MRKSILFVALLAAIVLTGCQKENSFDTSLILGRWVTGTEHWVYESAGLGHTWDTGDDVTEDEASQFTWSASGSTLTITHIGEMGEQIPKIYTIKTLTSTSFIYSDTYGKTYSLTKE